MKHFNLKGTRALLLSVTLAGSALLAGGVDAQTLRAVMHSDLRVLDPILTTAYMSRNHGGATNRRRPCQHILQIQQ